MKSFLDHFLATIGANKITNGVVREKHHYTYEAGAPVNDSYSIVVRGTGRLGTSVRQEYYLEYYEWISIKVGDSYPPEGSK